MCILSLVLFASKTCSEIIAFKWRTASDTTLACPLSLLPAPQVSSYPLIPTTDQNPRPLLVPGARRDIQSPARKTAGLLKASSDSWHRECGGLPGSQSGERWKRAGRSVEETLLGLELWQEIQGELLRLIWSLSVSSPVTHSKQHFISIFCRTPICQGTRFSPLWSMKFAKPVIVPLWRMMIHG